MLKIVKGIRGHYNNSWNAATELKFIGNEGIILAPNYQHVCKDSWA
jgi:hypothetical protein